MTSALDNTVTTRLATDEDFENILEISQGIYDGDDYLPIVFHRWIKDVQRLVLIGELQGNAIGLEVAFIAKNEQSFFTQALRLHSKYRGQKLSYKLVAAGIAYVRNMFPQISKKYFICFRDNLAAIAIAERFGAKVAMEQKAYMIKKINSGEVQFHSTALSTSALISYKKKNADEKLMNKQIFDMFEHKFILFEFGVYQLPEDIGDISKEGDHILADVTPQEIDQGKFPKSLSHGRLCKTVEITQWMCNVFTEDPGLFKEHVRCQLDLAAKTITDVFDCCIFQSSSSKFDGHCILMEEMSRLKLNNKVTNDVQVLYEQVLD